MFYVLRQRNFALLWLAGLISVAGDFALIIALPLHVYQETDSTVATAAIFAARVVPSILIGSVAGVFVDRWDRKRTMIWADLLRAVTVLLLVVALSADLLALVFLVAAVQGSIGLFFDPAESALLPLLVGEEHLVTANALNALNNNLGRLIGPAVGAWVYATGGLGSVAVIDSLTFRRLGRADRADRGAAAQRATGRPPPDQAASAGVMLGEWREGLATRAAIPPAHGDLRRRGVWACFPKARSSPSRSPRSCSMCSAAPRRRSAGSARRRRSAD